MNRVAISFGNINIYWYSIMIVIGIILALALMIKEVKRQEMNVGFFVNLAFYVILFGIIGARLYYVLFNLDYYMSDPVRIIKIWEGGLAIHGGIFVGILVVILYCQKYDARLMKVLDICVVSVILAQIIGRWGNFFNQEVFGNPTTRTALEALKIPAFIIDGMKIDHVYYQPCFLYESIWNFFGLIFMLIVRRMKKTKIGFLTGFYLVWYSIGRFFIERLRQDSLMIGDFKVAILVSIGMFIAGVIILIKCKKSPREEFLYNETGRDNVFF